jgi:hypothetical protein
MTKAKAAQSTEAPTEAQDEAPKPPAWFDQDIHRITAAGIVLAATGDVLGEDGRPVNRHAAQQAEQPPAPQETAAATIQQED